MSRARATSWLSGLAIVLVALLARLHGLGFKPFWLDEVFTVHRASRPLAGVIAHSLAHHHTPVFFLIEHAVIALSGSAGPFALRLVPAIFGAITAGLVFAIAWTIGGRAGAWLAGLFMALAPLQVGFAQEARSYTMMTAVILLGLWGLILLTRSPARRPLTGWLAYAAGTLGALWTLGDALPWLIAANLAMGVAILPRVPDRSRFLLRWATVQIGIIAAAIPVYLAILRAEHDHVMRSFGWIPPLSWRSGWADAASLYGIRDATMVTMRLLPTPLGAVAILMFGLAGLGAWHLRDRAASLITLAIAFLALPVTLALVSLIHPVLLPRYLLWSAAPFFVLAGIGIEAFGPRLRTSLAAAASILLVVNLLPYYHAETKPRWDEAATILAQRIAPGDMLLVSDGAAPAMLAYETAGTAADHPPWPATRHLRKAQAALAASHRVFAVYGPAGQGKPPGKRAFFARVASIGGTAAPIEAGDEITIEQIDPGSRGLVACSNADADPATCD
ncbi:glycosyltransferase family 39 protein [Acidiphilium acidophilum]|uniref:Glycosyltransferase family 39 protein n=1 Tax=Acidiphilium acidophilum TaxID=76588 RepID=A0AAW9DRA0_ACIAO|nr:glycosyltransferase family 39 protein [Acidiphilium acidophilum]MDX5931172.1 glycosyltransferase family 39 protein [Acidiphilium acidophilum]